MTKEIVFWDYDTFPGVLWSEVVETDGLKVKVAGYGGMKVKPRLLLPEEDALELIDMLKQLVHSRNIILMMFNSTVAHYLELYKPHSKEKGK